MSRQPHEMAVMNWVGGFNGRPNGRGGHAAAWVVLRNGYLGDPTMRRIFRMGLAMGVGTGPAAAYFSRDRGCAGGR